MKIIKQGKKPDVEPDTFTCDACGTVFQIEADDTYFDPGPVGHVDDRFRYEVQHYPEAAKKTRCPTCSAIIVVSRVEGHTCEQWGW